MKPTDRNGIPLTVGCTLVSFIDNISKCKVIGITKEKVRLQFIATRVPMDENTFELTHSYIANHSAWIISNEC